MRAARAHLLQHPMAQAGDPGLGADEILNLLNQTEL